MNEFNKIQKESCAIHQCGELSKKEPIINEKKMYYVCGKCLKEFNQIIIELSLLMRSHALEAMRIPGLREKIQKLISL